MTERNLIIIQTGPRYVRIEKGGEPHMEQELKLMREALEQSGEIQFVWGTPKFMGKIKKVFDGV